MSSPAPIAPAEQPDSGRFGLRLASWYAVVFVVSSLAIVLLTYALLAARLRSAIARSSPRRCASTRRAMRAAGSARIARAVDLEQRTGGRERLFVRVVRGGSETLFASIPPDWADFDVSPLAGRDSAWDQVLSGSRRATLEVASARLIDGTLLQVGKSTESRDELLARFRTVALLVSIAIVLAGLAGGFVVTRSTMRPIEGLIAAVRNIIATGRTDARVPVREPRDAIDELSSLFNAMLDRITILISGMGDALDNVAARPADADDAPARHRRARPGLGRSRHRSARRSRPVSKSRSGSWRCSTR